jgi:RIO-like serine/threonine protein kinase
MYVLIDDITGHRVLFERGYLHGDVSCGNVMFRRKNGVVEGVLLDYNQVKHRDGNARVCCIAQ